LGAPNMPVARSKPNSVGVAANNQARSCGDPAGDPDDDPEVQLSAMVPRRVRRAVRLYAEQQGVTVRTVLLGLIRDAGIVDVSDAELVDRRSVAGALKAAPSTVGGGVRRP